MVENRDFSKLVGIKLVKAYEQNATCSITGIHDEQHALSAHHINKKEFGGEDTYNNIDLIGRGIHDWIHHIEYENPDLFYLLTEVLLLGNMVMRGENIFLKNEYVKVKSLISAEYQRYESKKKSN